jgi:hypothetical protein
MLYAHCLDTILSQSHGDSDEAVARASRDAERVMANIAVVPFTGATGYVIIDGQGNREPDYTVSQLWGTELVTLINMNPKTGSFDIVNFTQTTVFVSSFNGSVTWRFQGTPFLYPGNTTDRPPNVEFGIQPCNAGSFFDESKNDCRPCAAGYYSAEAQAATSCAQCRAGYAQKGGGSSSCDPCAAGQHPFRFRTHPHNHLRPVQHSSKTPAICWLCSTCLA